MDQYSAVKESPRHNSNLIILSDSEKQGAVQKYRQDGFLLCHQGHMMKMLTTGDAKPPKNEFYCLDCHVSMPLFDVGFRG